MTVIDGIYTPKKTSQISTPSRVMSSQREEVAGQSYKLLEDSIDGLLDWVNTSYTIKVHTMNVDTVANPQTMGVSVASTQTVVKSVSDALLRGFNVDEYNKNLRFYLISATTWIWYAINTVIYKLYIAASELFQLSQTLPRKARKMLAGISEYVYILSTKDLRELAFIEIKLSTKLFTKKLGEWVTTLAGIGKQYYLALTVIGSLFVLGLSTVVTGKSSFLQSISARNTLSTVVSPVGVGGSNLLSRDILRLKKQLPRSFILEHTAEAGQTASYLSTLYGVKEETVLFNNTGLTATIEAGTKVYIPPIDGYIKVASKDEVVSEVARIYKVSIADLETYNPDIVGITNLPEAQVVLIPISDFGLVKQYQTEESDRLKAEEKKTAAATFRTQALAGAAYKKLDFLDSNRVADLDFGLPVDEAYNRATTYWGHTNNAVDFGGGNSNPNIYAAAGGIVVEVQSGLADVSCVGSAGCFTNGYANYITVDHGGGYKTRYAHLRSVNVQIGQKVSKGELIGIMGQAGYTFGIHLHFEVLKDGYGVFPPYVIPAIRM
jgi:murein DD-endopeptidase MepM/ murein hydrolase activator NlpD